MADNLRPWASGLAAAGLWCLMATESAAETAISGVNQTASDVGEVVVTAVGQSQALSKVAQSLTAFTPERMDVLAIKSAVDLVKFSPGVNYEEDRHDISIRGIQSDAGSGTTGIYIDDTPIQLRALGQNANNTQPLTFDVERIEVLRGPQGTLFGAGSEGGAIRYITRTPSLTQFSAMGHAEAASTQAGGGSYEAGLAVGGPIRVGKLGFRLSGWLRRDGGYIDRIDSQTGQVTEANANRKDNLVVRGTLNWMPMEHLTLVPSVNYQKVDQHNYNDDWLALSALRGHLSNGTPDRIANSDRFLLPALKVEYDFRGVSLIANSSYYDRQERTGGYSGTLHNLSYFQQLIGDGLLPLPNSQGQTVACSNNCVSLYPLLTPGGLNLPGLPGYVAHALIINGQQNFTQEVRLQSNNPQARLIWTVGLFYAFDRQQSTEMIIDPQLASITQLLWGTTVLQAWGEAQLAGDLDYINSTKASDRQTAVFAEATYRIVGRLSLTAGLRYAWNHYEFVNLNDGPQDLLGNGGVPNINAGHQEERPFTPKASLNFQINSQDLVYISVAKGYRVGGVTPPLPRGACGSGFNATYASDTVVSYEAGTKDHFLDRRLQIDASAFYIQWRNIQQEFVVPACGIGFTTNAGDALSKGFDLQTQFNLIPALKLEFAVGYTNARFTRNAVDANGDLLSAKGDWLNVSPWTLTVGAQYGFKVAGDPGFVRLDYEFISHRPGTQPSQDPATAFYDPGLVTDGANHLVSFRAGLELEHWGLAVYVNNLLNTHPRFDLTHQDQFTTLYEARTFRPRTISLAASFNY